MRSDAAVSRASLTLVEEEDKTLISVPRKDDMNKIKELFEATCKKWSMKKRYPELTQAQRIVLRNKLSQMSESVFTKVNDLCRFGCESWKFEDGENTTFSFKEEEKGAVSKEAEVMEPLDRSLANSVATAETDLADLVEKVVRYKDK